MSDKLKILLAFADLLLVAVVAAVLLAGFGAGDIAARLQEGASLTWDGFYPFSREPGLFGLTPLIWTALVAAPVILLVPALSYWFEKKRVPNLVRFTLARIRILALVLIFLIMAGPALVDSESYTEGSKIAVLIDDSLSMGGEAREFPVHNVLDDRESDSVRRMREDLRGLGLNVEEPSSKGFVTLSDDELAVRKFVRQAVTERAARLTQRLRELHGGDFNIASWQATRAEMAKLAEEAAVKQSELSAELGKDAPEPGRVRRLESELTDLMNRQRRAEENFDSLLGGGDDEAAAEARERKKALIENLLETAHPDGPRRWDIACELVAAGNTLAVPRGKDLGLIDLLRQRAAQQAEQEEERSGERRMPGVRFFVFSTQTGRGTLTSESILEVQPEDLDFRAPRGPLTELDRAIDEVQRYYTASDDLSTILVLTDGRNTAPSSDDQGSAGQASEARSRKGVEVVGIAIGNPKPVKVLELLSVTADDEVLKGDFVDFKLKIRADQAYRADPETGRPGRKVRIILCEDTPSNEVAYAELNGRPVRSASDTEIELGPEEVAEAVIRYKPTVAGRHAYFIKLNEDRLPDEDTYRNNVAEHYLEVNDSKIKVLYLEQGFRWEARALNEALKRDKKLEYQAFFFEADDGWRQPTSIYDEEVKKKVQPLRAPFWDGSKIVRDKDEFFNLEYDVIIVGDIDPANPEFRLEHWDWLEEWVSRGRGGLILLAGQHHNPRSYVNIERAKSLFPVELDIPSDYDTAVNRGIMKYWRMTPAGRAHEVLRLSSNTARNDELWGKVTDGRFDRGQLNGYYWYARAGGLKPAPAQALARVTREGQVSGEGDVLLASMPYGNGMVLYLASDETFRLRESVGDFYFYRFWQNALRFVASRRLAGKQQRVDVYTDRTEYQVGDDVKIYVELLGDIYAEVVQNQVKELKELPEASTDEVRRMLVDISARNQAGVTARRVVLTEVSWRPGAFEGVVKANEPGQFDVWVRGHEESRKSPHRYIVTAPVAEFRRLTMDLDGLRARTSLLPARVSPFPYQDGRRIYVMTDAAEAAVETRERTNEITGQTRLMWDTEGDPWVLRSMLLVALLVLLAGEWLTRKLARLV